MAFSLGAEIFSRGFRFNPSPLEAATYYLPRLIAGAPLHDAVRPVVHRADVYACEPGDLARRFRPLPKTGHRFFFTHCKLQPPQRAGKASIRAARAAGAGSWHSQGVTDVVDATGAKVGELRKLRYKKGCAYTDWLMDEFSTLCSEDAVAGDRQYVFCNIYVSPRAAPDSAARQESAAFFAPPAPAPVVIAQPPPASKRPAPPQFAELPCPKRMRGAVVPTPPVVQPAGYCTGPFAPPPPYVPHAIASARTAPPAPTRFAAPPPVPTRLAAPPPVPTRLAAPPPPSRLPASSPPQPTEQQMPPPPLPVVRACHVPVAQVPAPRCLPQPSEKTKQRTLDPFEAAELRYEADDKRVAASDPKELPAALDEDDNWDDLQKAMEDDVPTAEEGSTMSNDEVDQHFASLFEEDEEEIPDDEVA